MSKLSTQYASTKPALFLAGRCRVLCLSCLFLSLLTAIRFVGDQIHPSSTKPSPRGLWPWNPSATSFWPATRRPTGSPTSSRRSDFRIGEISCGGHAYVSRPLSHPIQNHETRDLREKPSFRVLHVFFRFAGFSQLKETIVQSW